MDKVNIAAKARQKAQMAREAVRKDPGMELASLPGKLADCSSTNPEECELYIVEGNSAGGTVKAARNRRTQAVLPLRGKILNVEKANLEKILVNNEIKSMISAFGCGIGDDFDINKLRFDKIIILTDADVDGAHIRTLLLTFFYRFMPELIMEGKIFRGLPPLYRAEYEEATSSKGKKATKGKKLRYLFNDFELEKFRKEGHKIISLPF